jgi:aryl-alcohol dehydrogenase-like predicted oxidoreductase
VSYIDTAAAYGASHELLGQLAALLNAHQVRLCTKVTVDSSRPSAEALTRKIETSLQELRRDSVDTLLLHSVTRDVLLNPVVAEVLEVAKGKQCTRLTGASTYGLEEARTALGLPWCDVLQVEYSILNQSVVQALMSDKRDDQELVVRSVLCKGLLTPRRQHAPDLLRQIGDTMDQLELLADDWGYTLPEMAIRFALDTPGVDVVLVGIRSNAELNVALRARDRTPLNPEQLHILETFDRSELDCVHPERWMQVTQV